MPFYFHADSVGFMYREDVVDALLKIRAETEEMAITPRLFLSLIRRHLFELLPPIHVEILEPLKNPSWDDLYLIFVELAARSAGQDCLLEEVALAIQLLYKSSRSDQRDSLFPRFLEVNYFLNMHQNAKMPIGDYCQKDKDGNYAIFSFCQYCWRLAIHKKRLCHVHQPSVISSKPGNAEYKEAYRQKSQFDEKIKKLLETEVYEFHDSKFQSDVLFPTVGIAGWLQRRRPLCWKKIEHVSAVNSDQKAVSVLLNEFHGTEGLPISIVKYYQPHNEFIANHPSLIWPMLLRAEAWFQIRNQRHGDWGGARNKRTG